MDVLLAEAILRAVLPEAFGSVDHENALADGGVFLVEHDDAGGDARAVEEIGGHADDGLEVTRADELLADDALGIASEEDAMWQNTGGFPASDFRRR